MNRYSFLRTGFGAAAVVVALAMAGCGQLRPSQRVDIYEATLSGAEEAPPVATAASGMAEVQHDTLRNLISWKVTFSGLSGPPTGAHIHGPAVPGQNAPVVVPFGPLALEMRGQAALTPQQVSDLAAGRWYVNIHSAAHPAGEIRGQLRLRGR